MVVFQVVNNIALDIAGGGAELFVIRLLEEIYEEVECHLIIVWQYNSKKEAEIVDDLQRKVKIHFLCKRSESRSNGFLKLRTRFMNLVSEYCPSVIHSHSALPDMLNASVKIFHIKKIRSLRTMHTDINWINNNFLEKIIINWIFPICFDNEISISKATKNRLDGRLIARLFKKSSPLIYNGISEKIIEHLSEKTNYFDATIMSSTPVKIISVGRLSHQKGFEYLLRAAKLLKNDLDYQLILVGDGPKSDSLKKLSKSLGLQNKVEFLGFRDDVLQIMAKSHIFVSSSLWEGLPTVLLEAMAIGLPVIATDVSGSREIIINNKTGMLVPIKNPKAIVNAIITLISNPRLTESLVLNAKEMVRNYSMANVAIKHVNYYKQL